MMAHSLDEVGLAIAGGSAARSGSLVGYRGNGTLKIR
jgi:hypothetical protein